MRKIVALLLVIAAANQSIFAQTNKDPNSWDLRRCIEYAMANNISVRQADVQARISAIILKQSKLQQIPSLNYAFQHGVNFGRSLDRTTNTYNDLSGTFQTMNLQSQATIFNWNSQKNTIKSNDYTNQADKAAVDKARNDIGLNVARQYLLVLLDIEQVQVNDITLKTSQYQLENTRKQVNAGSLPELNAAELEAQVARDSATYVASQTSVELDKLALKGLLNLPADQPFNLETPPVESIPVDNILEERPEQVYALAIKTQPQIRVNSLRLMASQKTYEANKGRLYPTISAFGQLNTQFQVGFKGNTFGLGPFAPTQSYAQDPNNALNKFPVYVQSPIITQYSNNFGALWNGYWKTLSDNFGQSLGIGINVPIFNGWQARSVVERSKLDIENKQLTVEQDTLRLKQDVYSAYSQASGAFQTFEARKKSLATAERSFDLATRRYNIGVMQTIEWLNNQNNLYTARINVLIAQFDYVFKMKVLEYYKGQGLRL